MTSPFGLTAWEQSDLRQTEEQAQGVRTVSVYRLARRVESVEALAGITSWPAAVAVANVRFLPERVPPTDAEDGLDHPPAGGGVLKLRLEDEGAVRQGDVVAIPNDGVWLCGPESVERAGILQVVVPVERVPAAFVPAPLR